MMMHYLRKRDLYDGRDLEAGLTWAGYLLMVRTRYPENFAPLGRALEGIQKGHVRDLRAVSCIVLPRLMTIRNVDQHIP